MAALLAPILILLTGLAVPLGWLKPEALDFERMSMALDSLPTALTMLVTIVLFLWHAAHRLRVTAHDLDWFSDSVAAVLFYGMATFGTVTSALLIGKLFSANC